MHSSGKCLCGAVSFTVEFPSNWVAHCHCSLCQKTHGAAFVTWVGLERSQVSIQNQDDLLSWYPSSEGAKRGFCSRCGSSLFFCSLKWPTEIHITRANFIERVDREPQVHAYYDTHVTWFDVNSDLPKKSEPNA